MNFCPWIIGRGRLARHLLHLFELRGISTLHEPDARSLNAGSLSQIPERDRRVTHAWLAVSDQALILLRDRLRTFAPTLAVIHSSAATAVPDASTLHPLMTFSSELYSSEKYDRIPWTTFAGEPALPRLFERVRQLPSAERVRYHAACVVLSNYSQMLWSAGESLVPSLSAQDWAPMLQQTLDNFNQQGISALTGPLLRGDLATLESHRRALAESPALSLYDSFIRYYQEVRS